VNFLLILPFLFSLLGISAGYGLALINPEELDFGKKYFIFTKQVIYLSIFTLISFSLFNSQSFSYLIILILVTLSLLILINKTNYLWLELPSYSLFIISTFLIFDVNLKLILLSLIFLYGFPLGSLIKMER
jgi:hypothetical protein